MPLKLLFHIRAQLQTTQTQHDFKFLKPLKGHLLHVPRSANEKTDGARMEISDLLKSHDKLVFEPELGPRTSVWFARPLRTYS